MTKIVINQDYGGFALSEAQQKACGVEGPFDKVDRTNPVLVAMVEAGDKGYSDRWVHTNLVVVEIPEGADYVMTEYDGWENIYWSMSKIHSV